MRWLEQLRKDKEQWKKLPDRSSKLAFLYDYYKVPILVIVLSLFLVIYLIAHSLLVTPVKLHVVLVNSDALIAECDDSVFEKVYEKTGMNGKGIIEVRTDLFMREDDAGTVDMGSREILAALFTMGDLDIYVSDPKTFEIFAKQGAFIDFGILKDEEILSSDRIYTMVNEDGTVSVPGILLKEGSFLHEAGYYHHDVVLAAAANADRMEESIAFIKEILK